MKNHDLREIGEFGLIKRIAAILGPSSSAVQVGIGDDAATIAPCSEPLIVTTDTMIEDVHFRLEWSSPEDIAHKALASNLSDLAAKGAQPAFYLVTLGLPPDAQLDWIESFYKALVLYQSSWGIEAVGGDTVRSPVHLITIAAWGYQRSSKPITLTQSQPGDYIVVTGTLGDAAAGLELLQQSEKVDANNESASFLVDRFLRPMPRIAEGLKLATSTQLTGMTDLSDGLARDLPKLFEASGVGATIDALALPRSEALNQYAQSRSLQYAWRGGEDYELLFTLSPDQFELITENWDSKLAKLTQIGEITPQEKGIQILNFEGDTNVGFDHFL